MFRGNLDAAVENLRLFTESPDSGLETYRSLAEAYERRGEPLLALRACEQALLQRPGRRPDRRKHRYYYSVMPDVLQANVDMIRPAFDVAYCIERQPSLSRRIPACVNVSTPGCCRLPGVWHEPAGSS